MTREEAIEAWNRRYGDGLDKLEGQERGKKGEDIYGGTHNNIPWKAD